MFEPNDLLEAAKSRFGDSILQNRVAPTGDSSDKEAELIKIAHSVYSRVRASLQANIGWPVPGKWPLGSLDYDGSTDISGQNFSDRWPDDLIQHALELFDWRTYAGAEAPPTEKRKLAELAEKYFQGLSDGTIGLGVGTDTDTGPPDPIAARDRQGRSLLADGSPDRRTLMDDFIGGGWDY